MLCFAPHYDDGGRPQISVKSLWQAAYHPKKKPVFTFLPASHVEEQNGGENLRSYCPCGMSQTKFSSGQGSFPESVARRRTLFILFGQRMALILHRGGKTLIRHIF
jgi:hypothetical protein